MTPGQSPRMLPASWVDRIFTRMQGLYGSMWVDRWRTGEQHPKGGDLGMLNAKATWAEELAGFAEIPECIGKALDTCRNKQFPPTLPEFLDLCRQAHQPKPVLLPAPALTPEQIAARRAKAEAEARKVAEKQRKGFDGLGWAKKLRDRYLAGERLLAAQIDMASGALGEAWKDRKCIPAEIAKDAA